MSSACSLISESRKPPSTAPSGSGTGSVGGVESTRPARPKTIPPAVQTLDARDQPDVAELVTIVTSRLPRSLASGDGTALEAVVEVQVKAYLKKVGEPAADSGEEG